jgi:hypothetical protein
MAQSKEAQKRFDDLEMRRTMLKQALKSYLRGIQQLNALPEHRELGNYVSPHLDAAADFVEAADTLLKRADVWIRFARAASGAEEPEI